jgi:penicillin-binding protein 2
MNRGRMQARVILLAVLVMIFFVVLVARLWQLQVLSGEDYSLSARQAYTREVQIPAQRGVIHDRDGEILVNNVAGLNVTVIPEEISGEKLRELALILEADADAVLERYSAAKGSGDSYSPMLVRENATSEAVTYISERTGEFPGVSVEDDYVRNYELGPTAAHVLGYTGAVSQEELEASDGELSNDATVGKSGVELVYEELLRGEPGKRTYSVDAQGRIVDGEQRAASEEERERIEAESATAEPEPGKDLRLSLDLRLQKTVEEELARAVQSGKREGYDTKGGASLAIDPDNGEILAMASYPEFDPQLFVGGVTGSEEVSEYQALISDGANSPFTDRAVSGAHPAASSFKPFTGLAGLAYGAITPSTTYTDDGSCWRPAGVKIGCWQSWREFEDTGTTHGTQDYAAALADSNDKYFYQVADRLWNGASDEDLLPQYYERFGFGERTGIDLPGEAAGRVPTSRWQRENGATEEERYWGVGRWVNMAIGQGDVLVTPVQLAVAYSALQNGGTLVEPHLALETRTQNGEVVEDLSDDSSERQVEVSDRQLAETLEGLRGVTGPGGTSEYVFEDSPLDVVGKTGTAQSGDGEEDAIAWFAGWAEDQDEPIVVVTMVEGGGGDEISAPAVREVLEKYHATAESEK